MYPLRQQAAVRQPARLHRRGAEAAYLRVVDEQALLRLQTQLTEIQTTVFIVSQLIPVFDKRSKNLLQIN